VEDPPGSVPALGAGPGRSTCRMRFDEPARHHPLAGAALRNSGDDGQLQCPASGAGPLALGSGGESGSYLRAVRRASPGGPRAGVVAGRRQTSASSPIFHAVVAGDGFGEGRALRLHLCETPARSSDGHRLRSMTSKLEIYRSGEDLT